MSDLDSPVILTLDVDWAPDWMVDEVADLLKARNIPATWFATHPSEAMDRLRERPNLFEIGIHPNFHPGSSHGETPGEVLRTVRTWFPEATAARSHSLYQSEIHLQMMAEEFGIQIDCSIFLKDCGYVTPHSVRYSPTGQDLVRVPHVFQDNMHLMAEWSWTLDALNMCRKGWKIFNFHPVHVALNSRTPEAYARLRTGKSLPKVQATDVAPLIQEGSGARTLFLELLTHLGEIGSAKVSSIVAKWKRDFG